MDLFKKGAKFLQENLDDSTGNRGSTDLENSLDGMAEKLLSWATSAPSAEPDPASKGPAPDNDADAEAFFADTFEEDEEPKAASASKLEGHQRDIVQTESVQEETAAPLDEDHPGPGSAPDPDRGGSAEPAIAAASLSQPSAFEGNPFDSDDEDPFSKGPDKTDLPKQGVQEMLQPDAGAEVIEDATTAEATATIEAPVTTETTAALDTTAAIEPEPTAAATAETVIEATEATEIAEDTSITSPGPDVDGEMGEAAWEDTSLDLPPAADFSRPEVAQMPNGLQEEETTAGESLDVSESFERPAEILADPIVDPLVAAGGVDGSSGDADATTTTATATAAAMTTATTATDADAAPADAVLAGSPPAHDSAANALPTTPLDDATPAAAAFTLKDSYAEDAAPLATDVAGGDGDATPATPAAATATASTTATATTTSPSTTTTATTASATTTTAPAAAPAASKPDSEAASKALKELGEVKAELADARDLIAQREKQLADLSEVLADLEARDITRREQQQSTRAKMVEALKAAEKEASGLRKRAEIADAAHGELKEKTAKMEQRFKQESADMEAELHKAQAAWKEKIAQAEKRAQQAERETKEAKDSKEAELKEAHEVVAKFKTRLRQQASGSDQASAELEECKQRSAEEIKRLNERLRAAADSEMQVRHEIASGEQGRLEMQDRIAELSTQLERAQAAYSEAAREVGTMSARLHELEFTANTDDGSAAILREELSIAKERNLDLDCRLNDATKMKAQALEELEKVKEQLLAQRSDFELRLARAEASADVDGGSGSPAAATSLSPSSASQVASPKAGNSNEALTIEFNEQIEKLKAQHREELQAQLAMSKEELSYLKRKNDEKDRRLEILTCERNALRYESGAGGGGGEKSSGSTPSKPRSSASTAGGDEQLVDLDEGLKTFTASGDGSSARGACRSFFADGDLLLRRFSKLLFASPFTRRVFYGYFIMLHIWIWVVLHGAAAVHAAHHQDTGGHGYDAAPQVSPSLRKAIQDKTKADKAAAQAAQAAAQAATVSESLQKKTA